MPLQIARRMSMKCPKCDVDMVFYLEDCFHECPTCKSSYWPNEAQTSCPQCGESMEYIKKFDYLKCPGCKGEFWPPEDENLDLTQIKGELLANDEDDPSTWNCSGRVYAGSYPGRKSNAVKGSQSSKHRAKKKPRPVRFGNDYAGF
jgi:hypothetical protein